MNDENEVLNLVKDDVKVEKVNLKKTYLKGQPRYWPSLPWRFIPCTRRSIVLTSSNIASAVVTGITGAGIVGGSHSLKIWNETWF